MIEIAIRENGRVRWVKVHKSVISTLMNGKKAKTALPISSKEFDKWWNLYDKKTTKKMTLAYWKKHITDDLIEKIMQHSKLYVEQTEKTFRLDPIRYLKREKWNDEIITQDKRIDIKEYKHDTTGMPMGECKRCGKRDTYLNQWELYKGSNCCGEKVLPFN
tara:strand:- start:98 stop:580 length:483 start_codon:yes stop_codon:yes gene_type:complete